MKSDNVYQETLPFPLAKFALVILALFTLLMLFLFFYQIAVGPLGNRPAPNWFYLVMFVFLAVITAFVTNFTKLTISIDSQSITVRYGMMKKTILWGDIEGCYLDESSELSYGGWGIRMSRVKGKWRLVYNVVGYKGVVLALRQGRFREFVFSTSDPDGVIGIVKQRIR